MPVYMVDRDLPRVTLQGLAALQRASIDASHEISTHGSPVRYIRSVFIPGEDRCLCLYEAPDEASVAAVSELARLPFTRIVAALDLTPTRAEEEAE